MPAPQHNTTSCSSSVFSSFHQLTILLFLLLFSWKSAMCQELTPVNLSEYYTGLRLIGSNGDTLKYQFDLGSSFNKAYDVAGMDFELNFPNLMTDPDEITVSTEENWLGITSSETSHTFDSGARELSIDFERSDKMGQSGNGKMVTVSLIRNGGFSGSEQVAIVGGGVVMIDNFDFKKAPSEIHLDDVAVFPNPAREYLNVSFPQASEATLHLYNMQGAMVWKGRLHQNQPLYVGHLERGMYHLTIETQNGSKHSRKIVLME